MIFVVSGIIALIAILLSLSLPQDRARSSGLEDDAEEITLAGFFSIFTERRLLPAYAVIFINMFLVSILFGFLPFYLHSIGYTAVQSGGLLSVATVSYLVVQPLAGHLADRFEIRMTVLVGFAVSRSGNHRGYVYFRRRPHCGSRSQLASASARYGPTAIRW
jgi:MFS transporter, ACDE family, multidrug resistance protein